MQETLSGQRHDVLTTLNYWDDPGDGSAPVPVTIGGGRITNRRPHIAHPFTIADVSDSVSAYTLDTHGFQWVAHPSAEALFTDETAIEAGYRPECAALLASVLAQNGKEPQVHVFNHKVRRGPTQWHHLGFRNLANRGPVTRTHVDQSYRGAELRLRHELGDAAADQILSRGKRWMIVNVWRPIRTVRKDPIAVADARTVLDGDLVAAEMVEDGFRGESWVVRHNPRHRWFYKMAMTPGEVLLIKCFDSREDVARRAL